MSFILSPNMALPIPTVGQESGPQFAFDINTSLTLIDSHDHTPGRGVQLTPASFNINSNIQMNGNFLTGAAGVTFTPQGSTPVVGTIYESGVDLYFVDGVGNNVRITQSGGIAGSPGSIANLTPPASASYISVSKTFVWQSDTNAAANMDFASATFRNITPNSTNGVTVQAPASLASNYSLTLPTLPAVTNIMTLDNTGNIAAVTNVDNSTIVISGNNLQVPTGGIQGINLANIAQFTTITGSPGTFTFTVTSANATSGATYTNNSTTFTVSTTISGGTTLVCTASGLPSASGVLTKTGGTGDATITFSSVVATGFSTTFTVPSGVTKIDVLASGGGGGGGGGGSEGGSGAAGGSGSAPTFSTFMVAPSDIITVVIGSAGTSGPGGVSGGGGHIGGSGGTTTITNTTASKLLMTIVGGVGGNAGGAINTSGGVGGTTGFIGPGTQTGGGSGGATGPSASSPGSIGTSSVYATGGSGGAASPSPGSFVSGGGGGGAAGYGNGANGGNGGQTTGANGIAGSNAAVTAYGAGGGGGGGAAGGGVNTGGAGGSGQNGVAIISWYGHS